ncbi:MAG: hypothetical protein HC945_01595 [Nitrosarchaeum sp.]|nr:hypothetical protein [Nitrosarchaeum sp.]
MEIDPRRLIVGMTLVFVLGVLFAFVNGVYAEESGEALPIDCVWDLFCVLAPGCFACALVSVAGESRSGGCVAQGASA